MGLLKAVCRCAYGGLGYQNQDDDGPGVLPVHIEGTDGRCLQEYALYRDVRV
jgi:hypothetical protein